jgi:hypothetical protein
VCVYVGLIAATMVYGVDKKTADRHTQKLQQHLADSEALLLSHSSSLTLVDAHDSGLVDIDTHVAVSHDVLLGRLDQ